MNGPRAEAEDGLARVGAGRALAITGVLGTAAVMAALPIVVASGAASEAVVGLAGLVVVVGAVKLAAMAWGLAAAVD